MNISDIMEQQMMILKGLPALGSAIVCIHLETSIANWISFGVAREQYWMIVDFMVGFLKLPVVTPLPTVLCQYLERVHANCCW